MSWNVGNSIVGVVGAISNHNIWAHVQILNCNAFHKRCSSLDLLVHSEILMQNTSSDCTERSVTFGIERSGKRIVQQSYADTCVVKTMYNFVCFSLKFRAEIVCISLDV